MSDATPRTAPNARSTAGDADRPAEAGRDNGRTHHADCYEQHHDCAIREVARLRERVRELERTIDKQIGQQCATYERADRAEARVAELEDAIETLKPYVITTGTDGAAWCPDCGNLTNSMTPPDQSHYSQCPVAAALFQET